MSQAPKRMARWRVDLAIGSPILAGLGFALALVLLLQAVSVLHGWSTLYEPRGHFVVVHCQLYSGRFSDRVECDGTLNLPDGSERASTMIGPLGSFGSEPPAAGATVAVYHRIGDTGRVFPLEGRTMELARLIIGAVPLVFIVGGAGAWLGGWLLTSRISSDGSGRDPFRGAFPQRFAMQRGGATWLVVGLCWWLVDHFFVDGLLGTAGLG